MVGLPSQKLLLLPVRLRFLVAMLERRSTRACDEPVQSRAG